MRSIHAWKRLAIDHLYQARDGLPVSQGAGRPERRIQIRIVELGPGHTVGETEVDFTATQDETVGRRAVGVEGPNASRRGAIGEEGEVQRLRVELLAQKGVRPKRVTKLGRRRAQPRREAPRPQDGVGILAATTLGTCVALLSTTPPPRISRRR